MLGIRRFQARGCVSGVGPRAEVRLRMGGSGAGTRGGPVAFHSVSRFIVSSCRSGAPVGRLRRPTRRGFPFRGRVRRVAEGFCVGPPGSGAALPLRMSWALRLGGWVGFGPARCAAGL